MKNFPLSLILLASASLPMTAAGAKDFPPEAAQKVEQLRREIQAQGLAFTVDVNPALQYDRDRLCGTRTELMPAEYLAHEPGGYENLTLDADDDAAAALLPKAYVGVFSTVKDQGQCGSCWAFSTVGSLEGAALKAAGAPSGRITADGGVTVSGPLPDLSEEQVLSCNPFGWGCNGGYFAFDMLMPSKAGTKGHYRGAVQEASFPYVGDQAACKIARNAAYTPVTQWGYVGSSGAVPSTAAIKNAIYKHGGCPPASMPTTPSWPTAAASTAASSTTIPSTTPSSWWAGTTPRRPGC